MKKVWLVVGVALLAACGGDGGARTDTAGPPSPRPVAQAKDEDGAAEPISCSTFYRSADTKPPKPGPVLTFDQPQQEETARFAELVLSGHHANDKFEGRSLSISVSEPRRERPLFSQLFQMERSAAPANSFGSTGQGFTGLLYAYSATGAELQFFCESG